MQSSVNIRIRGFSHSRAFFGEPFWRAPAGGKQKHWKHKEGREFRFGIVHALISLLLAPCAPVRRSKLGKVEDILAWGTQDASLKAQLLFQGPRVESESDSGCTSFFCNQCLSLLFQALCILPCTLTPQRCAPWTTKLLPSWTRSGSVTRTCSYGHVSIVA